MTIYYTKDTLEDMLEAAKTNYEKWEKTRKMAYLRDAANKLVAIAENMVANKINRDIKGYGEFRSNFNKFSNDELIKEYLNDLHIFFYEGLEYDQTVEDIEYKYHKAYKFLRSKIKGFNEAKYKEKVRV